MGIFSSCFKRFVVLVQQKCQRLSAESEMTILFFLISMVYIITKRHPKRVWGSRSQEPFKPRASSSQVREILRTTYKSVRVCSYRDS